MLSQRSLEEPKLVGCWLKKREGVHEETARSPSTPTLTKAKDSKKTGRREKHKVFGPGIGQARIAKIYKLISLRAREHTHVVQGASQPEANRGLGKQAWCRKTSL